jgi:hypothetical protein
MTILGLLTSSLTGDSDTSDEDVESECKSVAIEEKLGGGLQSAGSIVVGLRFSWIQSLFVVIVIVILMWLVYRLN